LATHSSILIDDEAMFVFHGETILKQKTVIFILKKVLTGF
jgi:hypothetical protein